jgi:hypothetical protein
MAAACGGTPKTLIPVDSPMKPWAPAPELAAATPEAEPAPAAPAEAAAPATAEPAKPR